MPIVLHRLRCGGVGSAAMAYSSQGRSSAAQHSESHPSFQPAALAPEDCRAAHLLDARRNHCRDKRCRYCEEEHVRKFLDCCRVHPFSSISILTLELDRIAENTGAGDFVLETDGEQQRVARRLQGSSDELCKQHR